MHIDIESSMSKSDSGQGHVSSRDELSRSCCMSVDAFMRAKDNGTIPRFFISILSKVRRKNEFDLV